jgi:ficolin
MTHHNGRQFTTKDLDNDEWSGNCAVSYRGAWWYRSCSVSNLNGLYGGPGVTSGRYDTWYHWKNKYESLKGTRMMVRPNT